MSPVLLYSFLLFLIAIPVRVAITTEHYVMLIAQVHAYYEASCVLFVQSGNYGDLRMSALLHTWSREFSRRGILSLSINFTDVVQYKKWQREAVTRPLFVVLLTTWENLHEFAKVTEKVLHPFLLSHPIWFVMFLPSFGNPLEEFCENPPGNPLKLRFDTEMLILCYDHETLREWYAIEDNVTTMFDLATWTPRQGAHFKTHMSMYERRSNLSGTVFRISVVQNMKFKGSSFIEAKDGKLTKLLGDIMVELSYAMNFKMEILTPVDVYGSWNKEEETWSGSIGQLVSGQADFGAAEFSVTSHRLDAIDFTIPLLFSRKRLYFKCLNSSSVRWLGYLQVFSPGIWAAIISLIVTTPILLTIIKMKSFRTRNVISDNYIHVWGIFCQQGLSEFPTDSPTRLAFISIFVSAIIVSAAYSASLISFLTVKSTSLPFSTLEDFANDGSYKLTLVAGSSDYDMFMDARGNVIAKMMKLIKPKYELAYSTLSGFQQVCREKVAFYSSELMENAISIYLPCKVDFIETGRTDSIAMALRKNSPFTGAINYHLQRFQDSGVLNRLRARYFLKMDQTGTTHDAVMLWDIAPILTALTSGTVLAFTILTLEKLYYTYKTKRRMKSFVKLWNSKLRVNHF